MTLRIGILGAARVAVYAMIAAAKDVEDVEVVAVAARDPDRARAYADTYGIEMVYPDYQALIDAPDVDAIYNALPPSLHAKWSIAAMQAGKPVLCEKPFALSNADAEAMIAAETRAGVLLMEAQHTYYHPINIRAREALSQGEIGDVRHVIGIFNTDIPFDPNEIRWIGNVGGGALWDLGVYPAHWLRSLTGEEPLVVDAHHQLSESGADVLSYAKLLFPSGITGELSSDMISATKASVRVEGSEGVMEINNPLSASMPQSLCFTRNGIITTEMFTQRASFAFQLEAFRDGVLNGAAIATRGPDSLATIRLLSAIRSAAAKE
jgi:predicted dehydrogenase